MSSQLRVSHTLLALAVGLGLMSGAALAQEKAAAKVQLPQQVLPTGAEDAVAAPAVAARSLARSAAPSQEELIQQLVKMTSESDEGLTVEQRANGVEAVNLEGRFMSVAIATPTTALGAPSDRIMVSTAGVSVLARPTTAIKETVRRSMHRRLI